MNHDSCDLSRIRSTCPAAYPQRGFLGFSQFLQANTLTILDDGPQVAFQVLIYSPLKHIFVSQSSFFSVCSCDVINSERNQWRSMTRLWVAVAHKYFDTLWHNGLSSILAVVLDARWEEVWTTACLTNSSEWQKNYIYHVLLFVATQLASHVSGLLYGRRSTAVFFHATSYGNPQAVYRQATTKSRIEW